MSTICHKIWIHFKDNIVFSYINMSFYSIIQNDAMGIQFKLQDSSSFIPEQNYYLEDGVEHSYLIIQKETGLPKMFFILKASSISVGQNVKKLSLTSYGLGWESITRFESILSHFFCLEKINMFEIVTIPKTNNPKDLCCFTWLACPAEGFFPVSFFRGADWGTMHCQSKPLWWGKLLRNEARWLMF